jgi:hypothetical protein
MSGLVPIEKYLNLSLTECPLALGDFFLAGGRIPAVVAPKHCFVQIDKMHSIISNVFLWKRIDYAKSSGKNDFG